MIGHTLKYIRSKKGITQKEISELIGVARNTVSQYETETIQPTFEMIEKIANKCGYKLYFENEEDGKKFEVKDLERKDI